MVMELASATLIVGFSMTVSVLLGGVVIRAVIGMMTRGPSMHAAPLSPAD
jgi:hypothetical protein